MQERTSYLAAKLTIDMGIDNDYIYMSVDTGIQNEKEAKEWARNRLNELPMTFVELGEFQLEIKRFYMKYSERVWNNKWTLIENCDSDDGEDNDNHRNP